MALDVLLVNPGGRMGIYQALGKELAAIEPPVWAGLMATFLRLKGLQVRLLDAEAMGWTPEEVAAQVEELKPHLCAVVVYGQQPSASTQNMPAAGRTAKAIKALTPKQAVIMVGGHVASLPERTLAEEACDFVAGGEGLHTLLDLAQALAEGASDLSKVRGLWRRDELGRAVSGPSAPLLTDLDGEMPMIAWDLLPMERYRAHNWHCFGGKDRMPYAAVYTTLGCPFRCSFCCIQAPFRDGEQVQGLKEGTNSYRYWSVPKVLDQLELLHKQYGVVNVKFADEMFVLNPRHILGIADGIIERGLKLNIWAYSRIDTAKPAYYEKLKRAGFNWLALGIEAASERVRDDVQKGFGQELVRNVVRGIQGAGIHVIGNYIFGLPEDDHQTMQATLDLALELKCEMGNFYSAMAYPGSALYTGALRDGLALPEQWSGFSQHAKDSQPLATHHISAAEVLAFRDQAFQSYFRDPGYLAVVREKFGEATVAEILAMCDVPLERNLVQAGSRR